MARKKKPAKSSTQNDLPAPQREVANGLTEAILGFDPVSATGTQVSQADTLLKNLRSYLVSNMRPLLAQAYVEHGLVRTVVDVPVDDGLRGGYEIKSKQLEPDQVERLAIWVDQLGINNKVVGQALKWNRLFGGAGILIMTDQDPATPLDKEKIGSDGNLEFRPVDMWELFFNVANATGEGSPLDAGFEFYNYYGKKVHKSRVIRLTGLAPPSFVRPRLRGWGFSIIEPLIRSINQYIKSNELTFEVIDEFKLDIFKIKNLTQTLLNPDGTAAVQRRIALANHQKNFQNALTMDAEDDYVQKQLSWSGLADIYREFRIQIASDMRMPLTKLFGISATGFNSGEDDIENYNAMVEGDVRAKCKYEIITILELGCQKLFGFIPSDLQITFRSLRVLSSVDEETVKTSRLNRVLLALDKGLCTLLEAKESVNKDDLLPVKVDTTIDTLDAGTAGDDQSDDEESDDLENADDSKDKDKNRHKERERGGRYSSLPTHADDAMIPCKPHGKTGYCPVCDAGKKK